MSRRTPRNNRRRTNRSNNRAANPLHTVIDRPDVFRHPADPDFPIAGSISNSVFNVTQSVLTTSSFTTSTSVSTFPSYNFTLGQINQATDLANIFDQYRLLKVSVEFTPRSTSGSAASWPFTSGNMFAVIDYDDSSALSAVAQAADYQNALCVPVGTPFVRTFTPHVAIAAYSGAFTSFGNRSNMWIDAASPNVQHYGLKLAIPATQTVVVMDVLTKYWFQFRNVR